MPPDLTQIRRSLVESVFKEYIQVTRDFWKAAERAAKKALLEWGPTLKDAFAQQRIFVDRQALRFGHLISTDELAYPQLSLNDITERLDAKWLDPEETSLIAQNPYYLEIVQQLQIIAARRSATEIGRSSLMTLQADPTYARLREQVAHRVSELSDRLRNPGL
jgi:hypothetical protein